METAKKEETPVVKMNIPQQCSNEIQEILTKYNCELICEKTSYFGQTVFVPAIIPKPS